MYFLQEIIGAKILKVLCHQYIEALLINFFKWWWNQISKYIYSVVNYSLSDTSSYWLTQILRKKKLYIRTYCAYNEIKRILLVFSSKVNVFLPSSIFCIISSVKVAILGEISNSGSLLLHYCNSFLNYLQWKNIYLEVCIYCKIIKFFFLNKTSNWVQNKNIWENMMSFFILSTWTYFKNYNLILGAISRGTLTSTYNLMEHCKPQFRLQIYLFFINETLIFVSKCDLLTNYLKLVNLVIFIALYWISNRNSPMYDLF